MCLRETAIAGVEPHTAAGGGCEAKKREKAHSTWVVHMQNAGFASTLFFLRLAIFNGSDNIPMCLPQELGQSLVPPFSRVAPKRDDIPFPQPLSY